MSTPFDLPLLLRPFAWGLVLLLVHFTQLSVTAPPVNAAVLAPGPGVHADFVQATAEPIAVRTDRAAEPHKSPPPNVHLLVVPDWVSTATIARRPANASPCAPAAPPLKGFEACGPPPLA